MSRHPRPVASQPLAVRFKLVAPPAGLMFSLQEGDQIPVGLHDRCWTRRGKICLTEIDPGLVRQARDERRPLPASFPGADRKGEPSCATVTPVDGWALAAQ